MTGTIVEFSHFNWPKQRTFTLDKGQADALADYCRARWPAGTAKLAAREWDLTLDEARGVVAGRASKTTIDKVFKRGGPPVFLPVLEEVWGESLARYFAELRNSYEANGERMAAVFGVGRAVDRDRPSDDPNHDLPARDRRRPRSDRTAQGQGR